VLINLLFINIDMVFMTRMSFLVIFSLPFTAVKADGSITAWGFSDWGGATPTATD
jgi:hypothetical protein